MSVKNIQKYVTNLSQTSRDLVLFKINGTLTTLAVFLQSDTLDHLRIRYGNWYNLQLMRKFVECDYYLNKKHIVITLENMETLGRLVIANTKYNGLTKGEIEGYLTNIISVYMPSTRENIQVNIINEHRAKIIFSL